MPSDDDGDHTADIPSGMFETTPLLGRGFQRNYMQTLFAFDPWRRKCASTLILLTLMLERMAFHAFAANLFLFLNKGQTEEGHAAWFGMDAISAVLVFTGISSMTAPLSGWLADAWIGKFWTITTGLVLQMIGYTLATTLAAHKLPSFVCNTTGLTQLPIVEQDMVLQSASLSNPCSAMVYLIIVLIGLGSSATRSNFAPFGAEQVTYGGYEQTKKFFLRYYWCLNIGCFVGIGALVWIEQNVPSGFMWAYLACALGIALAFLLFVCGRSFYVINHVPGSLLRNVFAIMYNAVKSKINLNKLTEGGTAVRYSSWLDYAKMVCGGSYPESQVEDVKTLLRVLSVFLTLIPYWLVYFQMESTFLAQGVHLRIDFGTRVSSNSTDPLHSGFQLPLAWLTLFDVIALVLLLPLLNTRWCSMSERLGAMKWMLLRIPVGMCASMLAVLTAAGLEAYRRHLWNDNSTHIQQLVSGTVYDAVDLSILWQVPQYALIGVAEAFGSVASIEYAYHSSPRALQGMIMGMFCFIQGGGSFLGAALVQLLVLTKWFPKDDPFHKSITSCSLHYYFLLLAGIQAVALCIYLRTIWRKRKRYCLQEDDDSGATG